MSGSRIHSDLHIERRSHMRKITAGLFISLDGVVEAPEKWTRAYASPEIDQEIGAQMGQADTMLLGRVTYETFAASFAGQKGGIADAMNNMPKVVVSKTLAKAEWQNSVLIKGTDELSKLKQQQGRNIGVSGSPTLVRALIREGLLDQLQLNDLPDRVLCPSFLTSSNNRLIADEQHASLSCPRVGELELHLVAVFGEE